MYLTLSWTLGRCDYTITWHERKLPQQQQQLRRSLVKLFAIVVHIRVLEAIRSYYGTEAAETVRQMAADPLVRTAVQAQ